MPKFENGDKIIKVSLLDNWQKSLVFDYLPLKFNGIEYVLDSDDECFVVSKEKPQKQYRFLRDLLFGKSLYKNYVICNQSTEKYYHIEKDWEIITNKIFFNQNHGFLEAIRYYDEKIFEFTNALFEFKRRKNKLLENSQQNADEIIKKLKEAIKYEEAKEGGQND